MTFVCRSRAGGRESAPVRRLWIALLGALCLLSGGSGCSKSEKSRTTDEPSPRSECRSAAECGEPSVCLRYECVDGACAQVAAARGTSCDNDDVCDGISTCDGRGRCAPGTPPVVDDQNPCTRDTCDPKSGPAHVPVAVDDSDVCTTDACNPTTGEVTHEPLDVDDGDDCTFDACDPKSGPSHKRLEAFHTCDPTCGSGFHTASRAENVRCGSVHALETFCAPDCGGSFYSCDASCPDRYEKKAETVNPRCGGDPPRQVFCVKLP